MPKLWKSLLAVCWMLGLGLGAAGAGVAKDWPTYGFDLSRDGYNGAETSLTVASAGSLKLRWSAKLSSGITAQPVVAGSVSVGGVRREVVYIGSERGDFYGLDAATGNVIWQRNLGWHAFPTCGDSPDGTLGVTDTAVIDRSAGLVYVVGGNNDVYALDLATGAVASGWPVSLGLDPDREHVWGGLTLAGGKLYVGTASDGCDTQPYYGRLVEIDVATRSTVTTWYPASPPGGLLGGGAIWSWGGASVDPVSGDLFVATGNSIGSSESANYGEHVVRLTSGLSVVASNYPGLTGDDVDFGSTPVLFRRPGCEMQAVVENKSGVLVLYDAGSIGAGPVQKLKISDYVDGGELIGVPAYSPVTHKVYVSSPTDLTGGPYVHGLLAFDVGNDCKLHLSWDKSAGPNGAVTSSPTLAGGVVYYGDGLGKSLLAYNAATGARLWDSGTTIAGPVFGAPSVVGGRVFVGSWAGAVYAFAPGANAARAKAFGDSVAGRLTDAGHAGYLDVAGPYAVRTKVRVHQLSGYLAGGAGVSHLRAVIYRDARGRPGALVAVTREAAVAADRPAGWTNLTLPVAVILPAGSYWLGYWYADGMSLHYYRSVTGAERFAVRAYSAKHRPPRNFPPAVKSDSRYSLYAAYTVVSGTTARKAKPHP